MGYRRERDAGEPPCRVVTHLIEHRHAEVKTKIADLHQPERELAALRARAARLHPRDCEPSGSATSSSPRSSAAVGGRRN